MSKLPQDSLGEKTLAMVTLAQAKITTLLPAPPELNPEEAKNLLHSIGNMHRALSGAMTQLRMQLGRLLLEIQKRHLHKQMGYPTWDGFLERGLAEIASLKRRVAYEAMRLAASPALQALEPKELSKLPVTNAVAVTRIEQVDPQRAAAPETIKKAQELPTSEFKRQMGQSTGYRVSYWIEDEDAGKQLQRVVEFFSGATEDAARALADCLYSPEVGALTAGGRDNTIDLLISTILDAIHNQIASISSADSAQIFQLSPSVAPADIIDAEWVGEETCPRGHVLKPAGIGYCVECRKMDTRDMSLEP